MDLAGFDYFQQSKYLIVICNLQGAWVQELIKIIKTEFNDVGKGWFNMKETSLITYQFGKLIKFLITVRLMMQDTLLSLVQRCYFDFYDFFKWYIPDKVEIVSANDVTNVFSDG